MCMPYENFAQEPKPKNIIMGAAPLMLTLFQSTQWYLIKINKFMHKTWHVTYIPKTITTLYSRINFLEGDQTLTQK